MDSLSQHPFEVNPTTPNIVPNEQSLNTDPYTCYKQKLELRGFNYLKDNTDAFGTHKGEYWITDDDVLISVDFNKKTAYYSFQHNFMGLSETFEALMK